MTCTCTCAACRDRASRLELAAREELAGRGDALTESSRPSFWRPRPGTTKAIARAYPITNRRKVS